MQISSKQFKEFLDSGRYTLIDIRTPEEQTQFGVISQKQLHIDVSKDNAVQEILKLDKSKKYLLYCWHGVRSLQVNQFMRSNGFKDVYDLKGGIDVWGNMTQS